MGVSQKNPKISTKRKIETVQRDGDEARTRIQKKHNSSHATSSKRIPSSTVTGTLDFTRNTVGAQALWDVQGLDAYCKKF